MVARFQEPDPAHPAAPPGPPPPPPEPAPPVEQPERPPELLELTGALDVSDSTLIEAEGGVYLFHTGPGISTKFSSDLLYWEAGPDVFSENPPWIAETVPDVSALWAPALAYFGGAYHLYYSASTFASSRSCIGHAVSAGLGGEHGFGDFVDQGSVVCSNTGASEDDWNAIDPHVLVLGPEDIWLVFGSFMSGIQLVRLDSAGLRADEEMVHLAARRDDGDAVQAPILVEREDELYLLTSIGMCCRGVASTRSVVVGRAPDVQGPYFDRDGVDLLAGGGTVLVAGDDRWHGPGGSTVFSYEGLSYHIYQAYDAEQDGKSTLRISELFWDPEGWPISAGP